ncbi:diguanylate cyclase [Pseudomonas putida]|uniref:diguanylate cyclase n=1 Tax=Pseudomonas putida TaxID=303 RepID=A0A7Y8D2E2_PSEPU|nr:MULTISPECIES: diguanylate cyclase [Pseudomonas]KAF1310612.1 GGDEF domain-containing protein [Pseudomonas sp. SG-MS2]MBM7400067.1 diguanylate cyclase (GGDEF)-like protein/PAS domain S-box-containing protein [Pseudomonas sp. M5]NSX20486.1 diguanylate cyclase [Pseudomonas putida]NWC82502.1 diguanylate cyclase [Pseudomonas putida]HDS1757968.1 diguanylate cyclase [Pseudomonas putida]
MSKYGVRAKVLGLCSEAMAAWAVALVALVAGSLLSIALALATHAFYKQQLRQRFELLASERYSRIAERFDDQEQRLDSLRRFFSFSNDITPREFDGFARPLLRRTQAYSWAPRVEGAQRRDFERKASAALGQAYLIRDLDERGNWHPAPPRDHYFPVLYTQATQMQGQPYGLDLRGQAVRDQALMRALEPGSMAVSAPLDMISVAPGYARGLLMVAPVFYSAQAGNPAGYVMALLNVRQLITDGLPAIAQDNLVVRIVDPSGRNGHELLFDSQNPAAPLALVSTQLLHLADHHFQLDIRPSQVFMQANRSSAALAVGLLGGLLSLLLSALLYNLFSQRQRALKLVEQRTAELRVSEQSLRETHNQLRSVLDAATQVAIIATSLKGVVSTFNAGAERMLGYAASEAVGKLQLEDLLLPEELSLRAHALGLRYGRHIDGGQAMFAETIQEGGAQPGEWTLVRKDGSQLLANMLVTAVLDEQGLWVGYLAICIDVTERRRVHEALAMRDRLLEKLSAEVPGGIYQYRLDANGHSCFPYASQGLFDIYEVDLQLLREDATVVFERIHADDLERVQRSVRYSAEHLSPWREEYRVCLPRAGLRWVRGEATPEVGEDGCTLWHGYLTDISDLKGVEEDLRTLSVTDALTGIHNRRYFQERLKAELDRAQRDDQELAVIMLDIDHFKRINDQYGHAVGDHVLRSLCQRIGQRLRRTDVFCRLGGEEFMVLCPGSNAEQARLLAMELWQGVRNLPVDGVGKVTASFGVAGWRPGEGADALLLRADAGVYAAKQAGRDRVEAELS